MTRGTYKTSLLLSLLLSHTGSPEVIHPKLLIPILFYRAELITQNITIALEVNATNKIRIVFRVS